MVFRHWIKVCLMIVIKIQVGTGARSEKIRTYNYKVFNIANYLLKKKVFNISFTIFVELDIRTFAFLIFWRPLYTLI